MAYCPIDEPESDTKSVLELCFARFGQYVTLLVWDSGIIVCDSGLRDIISCCFDLNIDSCGVI
jgi:hypothetical protein